MDSKSTALGQAMLILNCLERSTRLELVISTWKDEVLPLHQERFKLVVSTGLEPVTARLSAECYHHLSYETIVL